MVALSRALAVELAPLRVRVNVVIPAIVRTPILSSAGDQEAVDNVLDMSKKLHPIGRAGEPQEVARGILFLARPENGWVTGAGLCVDGGRSVL